MYDSTVDANNKIFLLKISILGQFVTTIKGHIKESPIIATLQHIAANLKKAYIQSVADILSEYYGNQQSADVHSKYRSRIFENGFQSDMGACGTLMTALMAAISSSTGDGSSVTISGSTVAVGASVTISGSSVSSVAVPNTAVSSTTIVASLQDLVKKYNSLIIRLSNAPIEIEEELDIDKKQKGGNYEPQRHCKFWLSRIQGREHVKFSETALNKLRNIISAVGLQDVSCSQIRLYLKNLKYTKYNYDVPRLKKVLTGIEAPHFTYKETLNIINIFTRCVNVYNMIKPDSKSNTPYYPYIIYKIIENDFEDGGRKRVILESIHLQGRETLINHDLTWREICKYVPQMKYRPTDRNRHYCMS